MGKSSNSPDSSTKNDVFDVQRVRHLVELMHEYNLAEVTLKNGDMRIQLRGNVTPTFAAVPMPMQAPMAAPVAQTITTPPQPATIPTAAADDASMVFVKSPMVGTFYSSPNPDAPAFVNVGDTVGPETTVCILEAMKVFNEIQAECSGKIVAVLAKNGDPVEFGKPLFKVDPRG